MPYNPFSTGEATGRNAGYPFPPPPVKIDLSKSVANGEKPFFMIWRESGAAPTYRHYNIAEAEDEACRLSRLNPGVKFFVMASLASAVVLKQPIPPVVFTRAFGF